MCVRHESTREPARLDEEDSLILTLQCNVMGRKIVHDSCHNRNSLDICSSFLVVSSNFPTGSSAEGDLQSSGGHRSPASAALSCSASPSASSAALFGSRSLRSPAPTTTPKNPPYSDDIVKMCLLDVRIEAHWSILEPSGSFLRETQTVPVKVKRRDLEGGAVDMFSLVLNKRC